MAWSEQGPERFPLGRRSLFYLVCYLALLGLGLLLAPLRTLDVLGATGTYDPHFPRVAGMFLLGLAMITGAVIALRLDVLYGGIVAVRGFFCLCFLGFYRATGDPVFLAFFALVFAGVVLTAACLLVDRRREARAA